VKIEWGRRKERIHAWQKYECAQNESRNGDPYHAPGQRHNYAFQDKHDRYARRRGAENRPQSPLLHARYAARKLNCGNIGARDNKYQ